MHVTNMDLSLSIVCGKADKKRHLYRWIELKFLRRCSFFCVVSKKTEKNEKKNNTMADKQNMSNEQDKNV